MIAPKGFTFDHAGHDVQKVYVWLEGDPGFQNDGQRLCYHDVMHPTLPGSWWRCSVAFALTYGKQIKRLLRAEWMNANEKQWWLDYFPNMTLEQFEKISLIFETHELRRKILEEEYFERVEKWRRNFAKTPCNKVNKS